MQKLLFTLLLSIFITNISTGQKHRQNRMKKKKDFGPVYTAGLELECSIPSGPYQGGDQILVKTDRWEIHPDTPKHSCDCEGRTRCLNMEFATIGALDMTEFKESVKDAGYYFYNFFTYGFKQNFVKGKDLRWYKETKVIYNENVEERNEIDIDEIGPGENIQENSLENNKSIKSIEYIREKKSPFYANNGEFIKVLRSFQTHDSPHMTPEKDGTFVCVPQVTVALHRHRSYDFFLRYVEDYVTPLTGFFSKAFTGNWTTSFEKTKVAGNKGMAYLSQFRKNRKSIFELGDEQSKSLAFLIIFYFAQLFRFETTDMTREARKLELKYHLPIMSRIAFSDMFDNLQTTSKEQVCVFLLKFCTQLTLDDIQRIRSSKQGCTSMIPENLKNCDQFQLFNYINEESQQIYPIPPPVLVPVQNKTESEESEIINTNLPEIINTDLPEEKNTTNENESGDTSFPDGKNKRLTFSAWILSIVKEEYRYELYKLRTEKDDPKILPKTDLLSPPVGLRIMNKFGRVEGNLYRYGMGKYTLKDKSKFLVELRSMGRIPNMENKDVYRTSMNKYFNFLYHDGQNIEDIWQLDEKDKEINNIEEYKVEMPLENNRLVLI